ncbi:hypothetical protein OKA05_09895 [Luteolibacter arcticus]|uniref:CopG family transcriptional regulator n=1 Tax=Luteolibacter arcticus TaxID=1581411 RepID=A0ABT3GGX1_9BACT|nr:hypothetical protein [Luteolibacter arcticus]MCW1922862.1 hypothetical protein [Luteolibacter arcticus]
MKRTTLILDEACMDGVRQLAHQQGRPMSQVVNELLADGLLRQRDRPSRTFELPRFDMGRPGVNLADRDALESVMES